MVERAENFGWRDKDQVGGADGLAEVGEEQKGYRRALLTWSSCTRQLSMHL